VSSLGGDAQTNPPMPEEETKPEMGSAQLLLGPKRRVRRQSPLKARWRFGGSTRGSYVPPWSTGEPCTGGSAEVGRRL
jgi:hypothetical protein